MKVTIETPYGMSFTTTDVVVDATVLTPAVARAAVISAFGRIVTATVWSRSGKTYRVTNRTTRLLNPGR